MSVKIRDIAVAMGEYAPVLSAEEWDNVGLMTGEFDMEVAKVLVALDAHGGVIDEAIAMGADLIVTHHPLIFKAVKNVTDKSPLGAKLIKLIKNNIGVYSAHTNLDATEGGTNATLAQLLKLKDIEGLQEDSNAPAMGRIGNLEKPMTFGELIEVVKEVLGVSSLSVCGDLSRTVQRVGICTGKGASFMNIAANMGADVFITGDFGYHEGQSAEDMGLCVIDGTHYLTEVLVVPVVAEYLRKRFPEVEVVCSQVDGQTIRIV